MNGLRSAADRTGHFAQQPWMWGVFTLLLALGGPRGRRAATRGSLCYLSAGVVANLLIKPLVRRPRPPEVRRKGLGPLTSSFPSGHATTDVAYCFGAAQEMPALFFPLGAAAALAHWSLVRSRGHYLSDVWPAGFIGIATVWLVSRLWPPRT